MKNPTLLVLVLIFAVSCASPQKDKKAKLAEISYSYGTQYLMSKDYTQAINHLLKAAELDPSNPEVHNNLGMAYYFKDEKDMAKKHIQRALELDPSNTDARSNLGSLVFEQGDLNGAEKIYQECLKDLAYEKQPRVLLNLALIELRRGNNERATAYLQRSVKENENYCPAWFQLGRMDFGARRFTEAAKNFRNAGMGACANDPAPLYWQALTLIEQREYLNARMKLDDIYTRFPNSNYSVMAKEKMSQITLLEMRQPTENANRVNRETATPTF